MSLSKHIRRLMSFVAFHNLPHRHHITRLQHILNKAIFTKTTYFNFDKKLLVCTHARTKIPTMWTTHNDPDWLYTIAVITSVFTRARWFGGFGASVISQQTTTHPENIIYTYIYIYTPQQSSNSVHLHGHIRTVYVYC